MPQHQSPYHQSTTTTPYRSTQNPPTIMVPIPVTSATNGPLTIHVTLPENLQSQQLHLVPTPANGQIVMPPDQFGNHQQMHVIRIQPQQSPSASGQPQHIIIQQPVGNRQPMSSAQLINNPNRPVPHRFRNLTDEQIARRRKANAERSRRRRAMETAEQRAERNRRTAERMRQRRAKIAEERGVIRTEPRTNTLSADRFEEIFQSVVNKNNEDAEKIDESPSSDVVISRTPGYGGSGYGVYSSSPQTSRVQTQHLTMAQSVPSQNRI